jgi:hypothetical protein
MADGKTDTGERLTDEGLKKDGYNAGIDKPVSTEPVEKSGKGNALDVRTLIGDGVVEIHDDDDEALDEERKTPPGDIPKP